MKTYQGFSSNIQTRMTLIISVREMTPVSLPDSSATQARCTCLFTTLSSTSPRVDWGWHVMSSSVEFLRPEDSRSGISDNLLMNSFTFICKQDCSIAWGHPLRSVAENVPTSFFSLAYKQITRSTYVVTKWSWDFFFHESTIIKYLILRMRGSLL